ncbi:MAG: hypothetical protein QOJ35_186, partial [Solirubrobacteraceae bacterium]|nr:hypothetical protein [Solirubrobacteraceae bacterium]
CLFVFMILLEIVSEAFERHGRAGRPPRGLRDGDRLVTDL